MSDDSIQIERFDPATASDDDFVALNRCGNALRLEAFPEDPPIGVEETRRTLCNAPPFVESYRWVGWRRGREEIVATGSVEIVNSPTNRHLAFFRLGVLPAYRRQGIGRSLLERVAETAQAHERRMLMTRTEGGVPAGEAAMRRLGAHLGQATQLNQLDTAAVDRTLLRLWQARAQERAAEFVLGLWDGPYPEEALAEIAAMKAAMNLAPRDELEMEDWCWTPELLRQEDAALVAMGVKRWTLYVRELSTRAVAGYTETFWNPERPTILYQGDTAVFPAYRGRGLGRWLKAAMLEKVLSERPTVARVRTGNADSNAAMLKINTELGFKPYKSIATWQVELAVVLDYLATRRHALSERA